MAYTCPHCGVPLSYESQAHDCKTAPADYHDLPGAMPRNPAEHIEWLGRRGADRCGDRRPHHRADAGADARDAGRSDPCRAGEAACGDGDEAVARTPEEIARVILRVMQESGTRDWIDPYVDDDGNLRSDEDNSVLDDDALRSVDLSGTFDLLAVAEALRQSGRASDG